MSQQIYNRLGMILRRHEHHKQSDTPHRQHCALVLAAQHVDDERRISQVFQLLILKGSLDLFGQDKTALFTGAVFQWLKPEERDADPDHAACVVTITYNVQTWYPSAADEARLLAELTDIDKADTYAEPASV